MGNYTRKEKETNRRTRTLSGKRKSRRNAALKVQERKKKCTRPTSSHSHVDKNEQPNSFGKAESIVANGTASPDENPPDRIQTTPDRQILNDSVENTTETVLITGRRLFDVGYLFKQLLASEKHAPFDCDITNMYVVKELRKGLQSSFELKCKMCGITTTLLTENPEEEGILNINLAVTLACVSTGVGYAQLDELAAAINMPNMSDKTYCTRCMSHESTETDAEFDDRYVLYFSRKDIDGWELRKGMNDLCGMDLIPEPRIIIAAMKACRRVNDYALAVRFLEAIKNKCGQKVKEIYPYIINEIQPTLTELGIDTPEQLGIDKPELALQSVYDMS
ncbi:hypothetical protein ILUMI_19126 [Ignelater luminosus]|uniref:Cytochrome c oxidase subunit 5A, mitochondrial n=1 Tax=Ignelater luminosus TaxID=2038154 RepID=A0A8K0CMY9_IGNLU|nr:hypothetical protein ILUMI_19126 [Ignelater luminosus]